MKKILMAIALFAFPAMALTGCGGSDGGPVESTSESDGSMSDAQQKEYEEAMKNGGGGSTPPGN